MADNEVLARLEKQNEGITLGLGALAEVLQKMDTRLSKQESAEEEEDAATAAASEDEQLEEMYKSLVKDVSKSVRGQLRKQGSRRRMINKQDNPMAELNQGKSKKVSGTGWPMSSRAKDMIEETGEDTLDNSDTESVQMPIEAMEKAISKTVRQVLAKGGYRMAKNGSGEAEVEDEYLEEMKNEHGNGDEDLYPVEEQDDMDDIAIDEPILEDEEEGTNVAAMMRNMKKQISHLKKTNTVMSKGMEKSIRQETETRLRKMGFREEKGLAGPKLMTSTSLGASDPLVKSENSAEVVDQLAGLSWNELNEMRFKLETGETDGLPRELIG